MFHHCKKLESKKFSVSFDLRDEGYEENGTDGQLVPQISIWSRDGVKYIGRWDVTPKLGNHIYTMLKNLDTKADEEAVVLYIARALNEGEDPTATYKVRIVAGRVKKDYLFDLTYREACEFCDENHWYFIDSNQFEWGLEIVEQH